MQKPKSLGEIMAAALAKELAPSIRKLIEDNPVLRDKFFTYFQNVPDSLSQLSNLLLNMLSGSLDVMGDGSSPWVRFLTKSGSNVLTEVGANITNKRQPKHNSTFIDAEIVGTYRALPPKKRLAEEENFRSLFQSEMQRELKFSERLRKVNDSMANWPSVQKARDLFAGGR